MHRAFDHWVANQCQDELVFPEFRMLRKPTFRHKYGATRRYSKEFVSRTFREQRLLVKSLITSDKIIFGGPEGHFKTLNYENRQRFLRYLYKHRVTKDYVDRNTHNGVALHLRLGDFKHYAGDGNVVNTRLSPQKVERMLSNAGVVDDLDIYTDNIALPAEYKFLNDYLGRKGKIYNGGEPFKTLMALSSYELLLCSNSTYSMWATYFSMGKSIFSEDLRVSDYFPSSVMARVSFV